MTFLSKTIVEYAKTVNIDIFDLEKSRSKTLTIWLNIGIPICVVSLRRNFGFYVQLFVSDDISRHVPTRTALPHTLQRSAPLERCKNLKGND